MLKVSLTSHLNITTITFQIAILYFSVRFRSGQAGQFKDGKFEGSKHILNTPCSVISCFWRKAIIKNMCGSGIAISSLTTPLSASTILSNHKVQLLSYFHRLH